MKGITTIIIILIIVVGAIFILNPSEDEGPTGEVVFAITDAAADMDTISEVTVSVDDISLYNETHGWVSADTEGAAYNLLELRDGNTLKLAAQTQVPVDAYSQARLTLDEVTVTTTDGATARATVPSNEITIDGMVTVGEESTTGVTFDFLADQSLHTAANGEFVFASVIEMQSQTGATVSISAEDETVTITDGTLETTITVGTDVDGSTKTDFQLNTDAGLEINAGGDISILGGNEQEDDTEETNGAEVETSTETDATIDDSSIDAETSVEGSLN